MSMAGLKGEPPTKARRVDTAPNSPSPQLHHPSQASAASSKPSSPKPLICSPELPPGHTSIGPAQSGRIAQPRHLCSLGTGEIVHILALRAKNAESVPAFELAAQNLSRDLYQLEAGVTDVRICHPRCGRVCFVITFTSERDLLSFRRGPERRLREAVQNLTAAPTEEDLYENVGGLGRLHPGGFLDQARSATERTSGDENGNSSDEGKRTVADASLSLGGISSRGLNGARRLGLPEFECTGTLMPMAHGLGSLLKFLEQNVKGKSHTDHNVKRVANECAKWFPRREEYERFISVNPTDPSKYTRNLVFKNEHFEALLMCWPPGSQSSIHCHDRSSCWVVLVEGTIYEVQFALPILDKKFLESEMRDPTGAEGRCAALRKKGESRLSFDGDTVTYANNDIGVHRIENRGTEPAYTLHIYAPGLQKIKIFKEEGRVSVHTMNAAADTPRQEAQDGDILGVDEWNLNQDF